MSGRMVFVWLLVPLLLFLAPHPAPAAPDPSAPGLLAAASPADTPVVVNPFTVIVTAARQNVPLRLNPAATSLVGREAVDRTPRQVSINEVLATVPGVRIDNQADGERVHISIRGQGILTERGVRGIKVLLDGLPLNDPTGIAPDLYEVDWATVNRVEVLRGPAGALYGGGGSGGVINIVTADGSAAPGRGLASVEVGSYHFYKMLAEGGGTVGNMNYRVSMSHVAGDGYRVHNGFWADNLYGKFHWTPNDRVEIQQVLGWTDYFEQNAEGLNAEQVQRDPRQANPDAVPFNEYYKTGRFTGGLTGRLGVAPGQTLRLAAYFRPTKYKEPRPRELPRRQFLSPGATLQYDIDSDLRVVENHLSVGSDVAFQSIDELRFYNPGLATEDTLLSNENIMQRGVGVFVLDRVELARDWSLMVCGRYDDIENKLFDHLRAGGVELSGRKSFHRATGRAGLAWSPSDKLSVFGNWAQGFLPPATEELANNPVSFGGFNQDLTFATSNGEELGARGTLPCGLSYDLTGFLLDTKNDFDRYRGRNQLIFYRNAGSSRRYGAETQFGWRPLPKLSAEVAYTWSHFKYQGSADSLGINGNWLPNSPEHMLALAAEYEVLPRLTLGLDTQMQSDWQVDSKNSAKVPGFALWGAHASYGWRAGDFGGEATVAARNVFGASYMAFTEPDPDGNSYQPGPTQEYFARVSVWR